MSWTAFELDSILVSEMTFATWKHNESYLGPARAPHRLTQPYQHLEMLLGELRVTLNPPTRNRAPAAPQQISGKRVTVIARRYAAGEEYA
mgnify:CR=1 FL=1